MANTQLLKTEVELYVRERLANEFGIHFQSKKLQLITGGKHEFDAVSVDGTIVASIKSSSDRTSSGKPGSGKFHNAIAELYFLLLVPAQTKLLVLTSPKFHASLTKRLQDRLADGLLLKLIELPTVLQAQVDQIQKIASDEVAGTPPT